MTLSERSEFGIFRDKQSVGMVVNSPLTPKPSVRGFLVLLLPAQKRTIDRNLISALPLCYFFHIKKVTHLFEFKSFRFCILPLPERPAFQKEAKEGCNCLNLLTIRGIIRR